jgi:hypothetical protein
MSFGEKIAQHAAQPIFLTKIMRNFFRVKNVAQFFWGATSVILKRLPKEHNRPTSENSANLVTLLSSLSKG